MNILKHKKEQTQPRPDDVQQGNLPSEVNDTINILKHDFEDLKTQISQYQSEIERLQKKGELLKIDKYRTQLLLDEVKKGIHTTDNKDTEYEAKCLKSNF